ncbi:MAG: ABC transporter permease, partial [Acidobacteriota bacterium]
MSPRWARRVIGRMAGEGERFSILGDFEEEFRRVRDERGPGAARAWCLAQVIRSLPSFIVSSVRGRFQMGNNYLKIALRNFRRHAGYSLINLVGMAVGLAACLLIFLWTQDAMSYNRYHKNVRRLYRVYGTLSFSDGREIVVAESTFYPLARLLKARIPEVAEASRLTGQGGILLRLGDKEHPGNIGGYVDPSYFKMFSHRFLRGDPATALDDLHSCVLTRGAARRIFGDDDPLGRTLNVNRQYDVKVSGVIEDFPRQSDYRVQVLFPFRLFLGPDSADGDGKADWGGNEGETYVLLHHGVRPDALRAKISAAVDEVYGSREGLRLSFDLQPLGRVHIENPEGGGLIRYVPMFSLVALIVLLIACFNFINLTTARSGNRAKEVALRKTVGARRSDLIGQFFGESLLNAFFALLLAVSLTTLLLPAFSRLVGTTVTWNVALDGPSALRLAAIVLVVGIVAGGYPALFLSAFRPSQVLRESRALGGRGAVFRKALVVLQFSLSVALIVAALGVSRQIRFMKSRDIGFDRDNVVGLTLASGRADSYDAFRSELLKFPGVLGVTRTGENPAWIN